MTRSTLPWAIRVRGAEARRSALLELIGVVQADGRHKLSASPGIAILVPPKIAPRQASVLVVGRHMGRNSMLARATISGDGFAGKLRGVTIERVETFSLVYRFTARRSVASGWNTAHSYVLVKVTDGDGLAGWGETYLVSGIAAVIEAAASVAIGRDPFDALALRDDLATAAQHPYASSALSIALDDLRARKLGVPVYDLYGGRLRDRIRAYGASAGYLEGVDPEVPWPEETERLAGQGFTAIKMRIGRYPLEHERPIYEHVRRALPASVALAADGNAGYSLRRAIDTGRVLDDLGFLWFEEPMDQWDGYRGYDVLHRSLSIALAGGEITMSRNQARDFVDNAKADIFQPEPVICGGIAETLFCAELARLNAMSTVPHTSGGAIGIAAAVQVIAALPDPTRLPLHDLPLLEVGTSVNPWRTEVLATPLTLRDGWLDVPTGPGLGVTVDEAFIRRHAVETRVVTAD